MSFNARTDIFASGSTEGGPVHYMTVRKAKSMPSGDAPGKKVGDVLPMKRKSSGHAAHVANIQAGEPVTPVTVKNGAIIDGHHRIAAFEDAKVGHWLPYRVSKA